MRITFACVLAAGTLIAFSQHAAAEVVNLGKHNYGEISDACYLAGGKMWSKDGSYGCTKKNCDGNGGTCDVLCNKESECTGITPPGRVTPTPGKYDLVKILKFSPRVPPGNGLLEPGQGASPHGPSGVGTPKPAAPAPVLQ